MLNEFISSSNIERIGYQRSKLYIQFKSGGSYAYDNVPFKIFDALRSDESAGKAFHKLVRGKFGYRKLDHDPFGKP